MDIKKYVFEKLEVIDKKVGFRNILVAEDEYSVFNLNEDVDDCIAVSNAAWGKFGCTKCVFCFDNTDNFVVKIPFIGRYDYPFDEEAESFVDDPDFLEFNKAGTRLGLGFYNEWDYCKVEEAVYRHAMKHNLDKFFAKTSLLGFYKKHPIYISQKAETDDFKICFGSNSDKSKREAMKLATKYNATFQSYPPLGNKIIASFIESYGANETKEFLLFLGKLGLTDFHSGNIGYVNGKIKLIDYSDCQD